MIYPRFKEALLKDLPLMAVMAVDGDYFSPDMQHEHLGDLDAKCFLGDPMPLENVTYDYGVVRADPIVFAPIQGRKPDYFLVFLGDGRLVCVIDKITWSERVTDGRKLQVEWPDTGVFQL